MSRSTPPQFERLAELVGLMIADNITPDEGSELVELLRADAAARQYYIEAVDVEAALRRKFGRDEQFAVSDVGHALRDDDPLATRRKPVGRAVQDKQPQPAELARMQGKGGSEDAMSDLGRGASPTRKSWLNRASRRPVRPSLAIALVVMVAMLVSMAMMSVSDRLAKGGEKHDPEQPQQAPAPEYVAKLSNWRNAVWLDETQPPPRFPDLRIGKRLVLKSGVIEVKYYTGARVVIEGPAEFVVGRKDKGERIKDKGIARSATRQSSPANSGFLAHGSLVAHVDGEKAQGFTIQTPSERVEDLGTEFGVAVDPVGMASVAVFDGKIRVQPTVDSHPLLPPEGVILTSGQSLNLDPNRSTDVLSNEVFAGFSRALPALDLVDIGEEVVPRASYDSAHGVMLVRNEPVTHTGRAHSVTFYSKQENRYVTPLLLAYDANEKTYAITGIGRSIRTRGAGAQVSKFQLMAGSDEVRQGVHVYGHFDGRLTSDRDGKIVILNTTAGVVAVQFSSGKWLYCYNGGKGASPALHQTYRASEDKHDPSENVLIGTPGRMYSLRLTIEQQELEEVEARPELTEP